MKVKCLHFDCLFLDFLVDFGQGKRGSHRSYDENEWIEVAHWLYQNWEIVGGLSFLPRDNHVYQMAPYEPIDEKRYREMAERFKHIDFSKIITYEKVDETELKRELACVAGVCDIV